MGIIEKQEIQNKFPAFLFKLPGKNTKKQRTLFESLFFHYYSPASSVNTFFIFLYL